MLVFVNNFVAGSVTTASGTNTTLTFGGNLVHDNVQVYVFDVASNSKQNI